MLAVAYAMVLVPVGLIFLPLLQAAAFVFGGPELVKQDYPNWGGGILAGYGVVAAGLVVGAGLYGFGLFTAFNGTDPSSGALALAAVGGGVAVLFVAAAAEPAVFYFVARDGRTPVAPKKLAFLDDEGRDAHPVLASTWLSSSSTPPAGLAWR